MLYRKVTFLIKVYCHHFNIIQKQLNLCLCFNFTKIIPAESIYIYTLLPPLYNLKMTIFHQTLSKGVAPTTYTNTIQQLTYNSAITSSAATLPCVIQSGSPTASKDAPVTLSRGYVCLICA